MQMLNLMAVNQIALQAVLEQRNSRCYLFSTLIKSISLYLYLQLVGFCSYYLENEHWRLTTCSCHKQVNERLSKSLSYLYFQESIPL